MLTGRRSLAAALTAAAFAAGCGEDDETKPAAREGGTGATSSTSASGPLAEIGAVRELLHDAEAAYAKGDAKSAERLAGDAYLEHFEEVEEPLEKRDHELMESLEKAIATTLRDRIRAGAPESEVSALVDRTDRDLDRAEALLR